MTNLINTLLKDSGKNPLTKKIIHNEIRQVNLTRSFMMTGLAIPIALILSFTYSHEFNTSSVSFIDWKKGILDLNISIAAISALLFVLTLIAWSKPKYIFINKHLPHAILLIMAVWGTVCSIYNQAVSTSVITFLLICVVSSVSLLIHPLRLFLYLLFIYVIFFVGLNYTQHDPNILIANMSIGLITLVVCLGLSMIQWKNNLTKFEQKRLIKTQKKELEKNYEQLLVTSEELQKANQSKDKFFSILAHDLRGPITSTLALTHFLEESLCDNDEEERKRLYKLLQTSLDTTAKLLENILLWSRSQTGDIAFNPVQINLYECMQSNVEFLKIVSAQKDIKIHNEVDAGINVLADPDMMNTIFRNLISNAIKFTPNFGKVEITSKVSSLNGFNDNAVSLTIVDYGVGMGEKTLKNLFSVSNKIAMPGTNNEKGTGLGLVLCKEFIEKHAGSIQAESVEKQGSKFTINLPL
jgi:two-component system sensor histidine kinase/response regulator